MTEKKGFTLTPKQVYELKWFCKNVTGTRVDFYKLMDEMGSFKEKLDRLHKTCALIDTYFKEHDLDKNLDE